MASGMMVKLFIPCFIDVFYLQVGIAMVGILGMQRACGAHRNGRRHQPDGGRAGVFLFAAAPCGHRAA